MKLRIAVIIVLGLVLAGFGCKIKPGEGRGTVATAPATAVEGGGKGATPPAGFKLVDASAFKVADYKGQVLVMDFWATWCGPCKMEIPHLIALQNKYRAQGLVVVGISMDDNPAEAVPPYAAEVGMNYTNVKGNDALETEYGVVGLPTIVIYDRNGNKVFSRPGYIEENVLEGEIRKYLGPAPAK